MTEPTLYRYDAINGHPEDIEVAVRRSDGVLVGLFVPVGPDGTLTTTDNTEYILIRVGIGGDDETR